MFKDKVILVICINTTNLIAIAWTGLFLYASLTACRVRPNQIGKTFRNARTLRLRVEHFPQDSSDLFPLMCRSEQPGARARATCTSFCQVVSSESV